MAKKKRASIAGVLGEAVSDVANAVSVAATGSELGVLELAAEDELSRPGQAHTEGKARPKKNGRREEIQKTDQKEARQKTPIREPLRAHWSLDWRCRGLRGLVTNSSRPVPTSRPAG